MSAAPLLEIDDLSIEIGRGAGAVRVVSNVSFSLAPGEVIGLVGESGAGKSLTGHAVLGILAPPARIAGGAIRFQGKRIDNLAAPDLRRLRGNDIGFIVQDPMTALNPLLTIGAQIEETIRAHQSVTRADARARAGDLLRAVGMPAPQERLDQYPHEFSGGMRQRAVIALAIANDPALIVADEPTTALDVSVQAQILDLLKGLALEKGMALVLISHDMGVIAQTAARVAVMYAGRIVEIGPTSDVIARSRHPYTQGLMAAIPEIGVRRPRLRQIAGAMPRPGRLPEGCAFHPRCPHTFAPCTKDRPPLFEAGPVAAACWLVSEGDR